VWLLSQLGSAGTVCVAAAIGWAAAACFARAGGSTARRGLAPVAAVSALACLIAGAGAPPLGIAAVDWDIPYAPGKEFERMRGLGEVTRLFSATAEVEVGESSRTIPILGGDFGTQDYQGVIARFVGQDGTAPTMLFENASDLARFPFLDDTQAASAYVALAARGAAPPRVLVIGVGGGIDVMIALAHGASSVTAVEINRAMIEMVTERFDDYLGGLFRPGAHALSDRIELVHGEGRAFVRGSDARYDVIQLSGVDSFTALSTGAYTLSESYLYTTGAIRDLYEHLAEGGFIHFSRFIMTPPKKPRETLRLAHIANTALAELGVADPSTHLVVFQGTNWASTLIKRGPFEPAEIDALRAFAQREGFFGLVFDPLAGSGELTPMPARFARQARGQFHFLLERAGDGLGLSTPNTGVDALERAFILLAEDDVAGSRRVIEELVASTPDPGHAARRLAGAVRQQLDAARKREAQFLVTRRSFQTLLAADPSTREAFAQDYEYDVSASTDDAPFFFNYYRYASLFGGSRTKSDSLQDVYHPDAPVGHMILLGSLAQITLAAALLILLPVRRLGKRGVRTPGRFRVLGYFAALGCGFMFVEIVLMQKLVLFLGHPIHAVSVVLSSLLAFAGLGSLCAERLALTTPRRIRGLGLAVIGLLLWVTFAISEILPLLLAWPFPGRVAITIALLAPLAFALGMPFPSGVSVVSVRTPELVPWGWAVNAFLSVFSSIFCILLAMEIGFSAVLIGAALVYAAGFVALASLAGTPVDETPT